MNKALIILALTLFSCALAHKKGGNDNYNHNGGSKKDFDFYVFACEWTGTVCQQQSCTDDQGIASNFWNIHGLWPSDGSQDVNYCSDEKFNPNDVSSISGDLAKYWSGLYSSADAFHAHEWEKHGTCSGMEQLDFFSTVIQLAKSLDVYGALANHGITPGGTYTCAQIASAIKTEYGVEGFNLASQSGEISALELCISKDLKVQECPSEVTKICSGTVKYPKFSAGGKSADYQ